MTASMLQRAASLNLSEKLQQDVVRSVCANGCLARNRETSVGVSRGGRREKSDFQYTPEGNQPKFVLKREAT